MKKYQVKAEHDFKDGNFEKEFAIWKAGDVRIVPANILEMLKNSAGPSVFQVMGLKIPKSTAKK